MGGITILWEERDNIVVGKMSPNCTLAKRVNNYISIKAYMNQFAL